MGGTILNYEAKDILNKGRAEGRAEGKLEAILQSVRALMKKTGWSKDEAMDSLDIPPMTVPRYLPNCSYKQRNARAHPKTCTGILFLR